MNYIAFAEKIMPLVGNKSNISNFTHCVTRLRFNVKDKSIVNVEEINKLEGVMGSQWQGEQLQVIVGGESDKLYKTICKVAEFERQDKIEENLDGKLKEKEKVTGKVVVNKIFNYISPMMTTIIPLLVAASLCKVIGYIFGPEILGLLSSDSGVITVLNFLYEAAFYFMPVFLGYTAAKTLNYNPIYGIVLGTMIITPSFTSLVGTVDKISFIGIPFPVLDYSTSFLPVVLGGVICKYVLEFLEDHIPSSLKALLVPLITVLVMAIAMFGLCAPIGNYIGQFIGNFFLMLSNGNTVVRIIGATILTMAWPFLILFGMHGWSFAFSFALIQNIGYDPFIFSTAYIANMAIFAMGLGVSLKLKNKEAKRNVFSYFLTSLLGGISEPTLYGVLLRYKKSIVGLMTACGIGGLLCGIFVPKLYAYTSTSIFGIWACWINGVDTTNAIIGNVILAITFVVSVVACYLINYDEDETK